MQLVTNVYNPNTNKFYFLEELKNIDLAKAEIRGDFPEFSFGSSRIWYEQNKNKILSLLGEYFEFIGYDEPFVDFGFDEKLFKDNNLDKFLFTFYTEFNLENCSSLDNF